MLDRLQDQSAPDLLNLQQSYDQAEVKYGVTNEPAKVLLSISRHYEKVCRAFTGSVFTCSSMVTQSGESMKSVIKENGNMLSIAVSDSFIGFKE
ncbi:hypothetical protein H257_06456 [Aphanomyces astaci]|uniref:Uncharacterized protein n=1 Tax=Aphanomyces astaci TaxID=112090 RepID=W4GMW6_APHAT|nr:hypothetical protein H257_06456 [Aphanomyces astaci]ETV81022.1 hypothetical protein H257_06456 [Aphanomyces astaci]|eukprot:XP_009829969.1 hypothetical protein H257_06456 [Aphanomyces astaci]